MQFAYSAINIIRIFSRRDPSSSSSSSSQSWRGTVANDIIMIHIRRTTSTFNQLSQRCYHIQRHIASTPPHRHSYLPSSSSSLYLSAPSFCRPPYCSFSSTPTPSPLVSVAASSSSHSVDVAASSPSSSYDVAPTDAVIDAVSDAVLNEPIDAATDTAASAATDTIESDDNEQIEEQQIVDDATTNNKPKIVHQQDTTPQVEPFSEGMLVRDFISCSLYASGAGYFNSSARVYSSDAPSSLDFPSLRSREDYLIKLQSLYDRFDDCWLTPVEIFKPFYAEAIARWIIEGRRKDIGADQVPEMMHKEEDGKLRAPIVKKVVVEEQEEVAVGKNKRKSSKSSQSSKPSLSSSSPSSAIPPPRPSMLAPLTIIEMGGGNGTCAKGILDYIEYHYPELYEVTTYTIIELSEYMIVTQRKTLKDHMIKNKQPKARRSSPSVPAPAPRVRLLNMSIIDWREVVHDRTAFLIGLEVLDNMPHDRLLQTADDGLQQLHVLSGAPQDKPSKDLPHDATQQRYHEVPGPLTDPWIIEYGEYWMQSQSIDRDDDQSMMNTFARNPFATVALSLSQLGLRINQYLQYRRTVWFPTTSLQLLHIIKHYFPHHHILLADFSHLPSTVEGKYAPVVSEKSKASKGKTVDYTTYLMTLGRCDIFFPTDFHALTYAYKRVCGRRTHKQIEDEANNDKDSDATTNSKVSTDSTASPSSPPSSLSSTPSSYSPRTLTQHEFMRTYASPSADMTTTKNGFNPMWKDYVNFKFFIV